MSSGRNSDARNGGAKLWRTFMQKESKPARTAECSIHLEHGKLTHRMLKSSVERLDENWVGPIAEATKGNKRHVFNASQTGRLLRHIKARESISTSIACVGRSVNPFRCPIRSTSTRPMQSATDLRRGPILGNHPAGVSLVIPQSRRVNHTDDEMWER
jgi:hypothetical protein